MARFTVIALLMMGCSFHPVNLFGSADAVSGGSGAASFDAVVADAPGGDAGTFDASVCPSSYSVALPGFASRYRVITNDQPFWDLDDACRKDMPGSTHLVVLETPAERAELAAVLASEPSQPTNGWYYVGAVQTQNQPTPEAGWRWLTGEALTSGWAVGDPDDGDGVEDNAENMTVIDTAGQLHDVFDKADSGHVEAGGACECDGRAMDPAVRSEIQPDPT